MTEQAPSAPIPTTVTEIAGFPYANFDEFVAAVRKGEAFQAVDQAFAVQWQQLAASRGGAKGRLHPRPHHMGNAVGRPMSDTAAK